MPIFEYKAFDSSGGSRGGIVDADSPREARAKLRTEGVHVTEIHAIPEAKDKSKSSRFGARVSPQELAIVTRQLATLLRAGITIVDALKALIDQVESRTMERILRDVRERVTQGDTLAEAMMRHPKVFSDLFTSMVKAGEASGHLDVILQRLAVYIIAQNRLRSRITTALTYPMVMVCVGTLVVVVLMTFVVPRMTGIFSKVGKALPTITQLLISISEFFQSFWWLLFVLVALVWLGIKALRSTEDGRATWDKFLMGIPVLGDLVRKTAISRFATTTSTLIRSGISVLESLRIVRGVVQNVVLARVISQIHDAILEGSDISTPLQESGVFPPMVGYMIATGEQSGQLEELLERVSESYDEEIEVATTRLTSVMEPLIILVLAGVVLFIVSAIVIPMMQMGSLTRQG